MSAGARAWAIPVLLGLAVGIGLWAALPDSGNDPATDGGHGTSATGTTTQAPQPLLLPFADSWGEPDRATTHLLLAPLGKPAALAAIGPRNGTTWGGQIVWQGERVALFTNPNLFPGCREEPAGSGVQVCHDESGSFGGWPLPRTHALADNATGPRLLEAGYNATRVTAYVFDEAGLLLASNANDTARFTKHGDYARLPSTAWYLGANGTAPAGTAHLPSFAKPLVDRVRPELDGLPVGGVASVRSNAYAALYGTLFVTVRVDQLVHAP